MNFLFHREREKTTFRQKQQHNNKQKYVGARGEATGSETSRAAATPWPAFKRILVHLCVFKKTLLCLNNRLVCCSINNKLPKKHIKQIITGGRRILKTNNNKTKNKLTITLRKITALQVKVEIQK